MIDKADNDQSYGLDHPVYRENISVVAQRRMQVVTDAGGDPEPWNNMEMNNPMEGQEEDADLWNYTQWEIKKPDVYHTEDLIILLQIQWHCEQIWNLWIKYVLQRRKRQR